MSRKIQEKIYKIKLRSSTDERLATKANHIIKREDTRKYNKAEEVAQKRGWLLLQDLVLPQCFYMPITQAAKEPSLGPATSKKKCRENPT